MNTNPAIRRHEQQWADILPTIATRFSTCTRRQYAAVVLDTNKRVVGLGYTISTLADINGDGADDLVIAAPTPADVVATGGGVSGLWVALSEKRNWVRRRIQDPVLGAPQLVGTSTASLDQIELTIWDRDADGRDEIALFASTADGRLELSLLAAPRSGGAPSLSVWWSSDALLGTYADGSVSASVQPLGPLRDPADGKRALRSELIVEANLGGERRTLAISGAAPNSATAR